MTLIKNIRGIMLNCPISTTLTISSEIDNSDISLTPEYKHMLFSGDITDAKAKDNLKSEQFIEEWRSYNELVSYCTKQVDTTWLDVRGNHGE